MFLANSCLSSLSLSSILPTLTAQTHLQTHAHKPLPLNQCKVYSNEIQLIKNQKTIVYSAGPIPREDTGGCISHRSFLELGGDGRWIRSNERLSNVVPEKQMTHVWGDQMKLHCWECKTCVFEKLWKS